MSNDSISTSEYRKLLHESKTTRLSKTPKYRNKPQTINGDRYDSIKEASRHAELKLMEKAGEIERLERQMPFLLIPTQVRSDGAKEREVHYFADFVYYDNKLERLVVEDVKSRATKTKDYVLKRKLMLMVHCISIIEV